jgi:hypothetical protein
MIAMRNAPTPALHAWTRATAHLFLTMLALGAGATAASAGCVCSCRDGEMRAWCTAPYDIPPICPARVCSPPSVRPSPPLAGSITRGCSNEQVCDPSGVCQWKRVCRGDKIQGTIR